MAARGFPARVPSLASLQRGRAPNRADAGHSAPPFRGLALVCGRQNSGWFERPVGNGQQDKILLQ
jgi:hypothetical protein